MPHARTKVRTAALIGAALATLASGLLVGAGQASADGSSTRPAELKLLDSCEPSSFNAALGDGACTRNGSVSLERLNAELASAGLAGKLPLSGGAGAWKNNPSDTHLNAGQAIQATNQGGEGHSFTEVAQFGGGCVPPINAALKLSPVAECANPAWRTTIVASGASLQTAGLSRGTHKFECLIHPWMRTTVTVR